MQYCEAIYRTTRWKTREIKVGHVGIGGDNPIRVQSMTTSDTRNVEATIEQIFKLEQAGCEIARVTVQGKKEAESCEAIKNGLLKRGCSMPLVADIHFYPPAAMLVAEFADKVRINPGNFVDRRASFKVIEYDDETYAKELQKIEESFAPLVEKCKRLKKAMRIGTNHGSLSDRVMNRFGDSPRGMVESALEFAHVCRTYDYHDFVFSMKASNPVVMIQAYRLLVAEMMKLGWNYPLHLGVTEAGEGEDGRIKSSMGIGALLLDGLGDTIRVSLTEDPWNEIEPCQKLVAIQSRGIEPFEEKHRNIESIERRPVMFYKPVAYPFEPVTNVLHIQDDWTITGINQSHKQVATSGASETKSDRSESVPNDEDIAEGARPSQRIDMTKSQQANCHLIEARVNNPDWILFSPRISPIHEARKFFEYLQEKNILTPVILNLKYEDLYTTGAQIGAILGDKLGEGLALEADLPIEDLRRLTYSFLQAARMKAVKTDYVSCPGCGRTLFDLQEISRRIREKTSHLPGVRIAIMGCIVNGPGEMADADFGYVGSKPGKIDLYVGKTCVERDIDMADADTKLIELIAKHGKWVEKSS